MFQRGSFCCKMVTVQLTEAKCNFTRRPLTSFTSTLAKGFLDNASLGTFTIIITRLIKDSFET